MAIATSPLRVGLTVGRHATASGTVRYSRELYRGLRERSDLEIVAIGSAAAIGALNPKPAEALLIPTANQIGDSLYLRYALEGKVRSLRLDVIHGTRHMLPRRVPCPLVLTVHDVFALERKDEFPWIKRLLLPHWFRQSLEDADALLCVSDATRARLRFTVARWDAKATTVHPAVSSDLLRAVPERPRGLSAERFALVVGDLSPRKNVGLLLRIWPSVFAETGLVLVIAGTDGWRSQSVSKQATLLASKGYVVRLTNISDSALRWLYESAQIVLCPSLAEGWGFPVTEALALGATVLASNNPAHAEAACGQSQLLDPMRPTRWKEAIEALSQGDGPIEPRRLDQRTWADVVDETVTIYRQLANRSSVTKRGRPEMRGERMVRIHRNAR